jgi:hypothetical protein
LRGIIKTEGILGDYIGTRDAIGRCCIIFHESGQLGEPISFNKINPLFGIDAKTAWGHQKQFKA